MAPGDLRYMSPYVLDVDFGNICKNYGDYVSDWLTYTYLNQDRKNLNPCLGPKNLVSRVSNLKKVNYTNI